MEPTSFISSFKLSLHTIFRYELFIQSRASKDENPQHIKIIKDEHPWCVQILEDKTLLEFNIFGSITKTLVSK